MRITRGSSVTRSCVRTGAQPAARARARADTARARGARRSCPAASRGRCRARRARRGRPRRGRSRACRSRSSAPSASARHPRPACTPDRPSRPARCGRRSSRRGLRRVASPGREASVRARPAASNARLSPSVTTISTRRVAVFGKKPEWAASPSAANVVARVFSSRGGGASMATASVTVEAKAASSAVGNRSGSTRSVNEATPAGMSGSAACIASAIRRACARRSGACGEDAARIESEVSRT